MYRSQDAEEEWKGVTKDPLADQCSKAIRLVEQKRKKAVHSHFMLYAPDLTVQSLAPFRHFTASDDQSEDRPVTSDDIRDFTQAVLQGNAAALSLAEKHRIITPWLPGNPEWTRVRFLEPGKQWRMRERMVESFASTHRLPTDAITGDASERFSLISRLEACQNMCDVIKASGDGDKAMGLHESHHDILASRPDSIPAACLEHGINLGEIHTDLWSRVSRTIYAVHGDDRQVFSQKSSYIMLLLI
jgi:hypothetical protein